METGSSGHHSPVGSFQRTGHLVPQQPRLPCWGESALSALDTIATEGAQLGELSDEASGVTERRAGPNKACERHKHPAAHGAHHDTSVRVSGASPLCGAAFPQVNTDREGRS
jgi:hypothetical protein